MEPVKNKEEVILNVLKHVEKIGSHPGRDNWDDYWSSFDKSDHPTYLFRENTYRHKGEYVTASRETELEFFKSLKTKVFEKFSDVEAIAEFGCGSGSNLVQLHEMYPEKKLFGFDWAPAAVELVAKNGFSSAVFDMLHPEKIDLPEKLGVFTCGSMEQLGDDFRPFLDFLLELKPDICVHIEPIIEFYDDNLLFDYLAIMYHRKRNYLGNFYSQIKHRCLEATRTGFGNLYNEGYNVVAWR